MEQKSSGLFNVIVRFTNLQGAPLAGPQWSVEVVDEDPLRDDRLGTSSLNEHGEGRVFFSVADVASLDSPGERKPDLYFILKRNGREVFRTGVERDVDFEALDPVTGRPHDLTRDFGTIEVDIDP